MSETVTFSRQVKDELAGLPLPEGCCRLAEAAGLLQAGGTLLLGGGYGLLFSTEHRAVAARLLGLLRGLYGPQPELREHRRRRLGRESTFQIELPRSEETSELLLRSGWLTRNAEGLSLGGAVPAALVRRECCRRAYLRGAFLAAGTIPDPEKGYDIEFLLQSDGYAVSLARLLSRRGGKARVTVRGQMRVVYLREGDRVADLLAAMGASSAVLRLENARIVRSIRADTNRRVNCESANIGKTVSAAARQIAAVRRIEAGPGLRFLSPALRQAAETRLEFPDASLQELADLLPGRVGKSAVNHRLRKILEIAERMDEGGEGSL